MRIEAIAQPLVQLALTEDLGGGDVTAEALLSDTARGTARIVAKRPGVIAGIEVAALAFSRLDDQVEWRPRVQDGVAVDPGDIVAVVEGRARAVVSAERVALNFLGRLSGIATQTRRFVQAVGESGVQIRDTRKTTPGLRVLEKYAVLAGGGHNHRYGLFDMAMIKENHLQAAGSIGACVKRLRQRAPGIPVEVEARTAVEAEEAVAAGVDWVLLDNMSVETVRKTMEVLGLPAPSAGGALPTPAVEASGGITLVNAADYAATGVHALAIGALTHSAPSLDLSLLVEGASDRA